MYLLGSSVLVCLVMSPVGTVFRSLRLISPWELLKNTHSQYFPRPSESIMPQNLFFFFNIFIYVFIYFWLRWVFIAACRLSLVAASRGYSLLWCTGFSLQWLLLLQSTGSSCVGFNSCDTRSQQLWLAGSRAQAQQLWCTGLVAPRHVGSSRTRA